VGAHASNDAFVTPQHSVSTFPTLSTHGLGNLSPTVVFNRATALVKTLPERWRTPSIVSISK